MKGAESTRAEGAVWELSDLYASPSDPAIEQNLAEAERRAGEFAGKYRGTVADAAVTADDLAGALAELEAILRLARRPAFYAGLLTAADTGNVPAQALEERCRDRGTEIRNRILFFNLEVQAIPEDAFAELRKAPELAPWIHYLEQERLHAPHTLSESEEQLLSKKAMSGRQAFVHLFDELTASWGFPIEYEGNVEEKTEGEVLAMLRDPDAHLRRRALESLLGRFRENEIVLVSIFNAILLDHRTETTVRRYASPIAERHLANEVDGATVDSMRAAIQRNTGLLQRYFRWKARRLGMEKLSISDVYAPIDGASESIPYGKARSLVLEAFTDFDERFAKIAADFFDRGWIDAEVRRGKRSGAFCAAVGPDHHPYVLTSYAGTANCVSTLAHEIGHGIHDELARGRKLLVFSPPLVLAETASVFGEMLLTDRLLRESPDEATRETIVTSLLDDAYATIYRQNALTSFELRAHELRSERRLDPELLGDVWMEIHETMFGDAVELPEIYRWGWSYIPHFLHTPFYCYAYSFGQLLVLALYDRYQKEGRSFVPRIFELLESGGSVAPEALLERIGVNARDASFWDGGFAILERSLAALEKDIET